MTTARISYARRLLRAVRAFVGALINRIDSRGRVAAPPIALEIERENRLARESARLRKVS